MVESKPSERLYLSRETNKEIYIDIQQLPQHQIDAIRFLYMQFKKKKPGVILNDPPGYGKTLQVVLFLNAIRHQLDKPILIMCNESETNNWMEHFNRHNAFSGEVVIEATNPRFKKTVYINPMQNLPAFCHKEWSVVVVDDDIVRKDVLKAALHTDYKIWVTSIDMKENLHALSMIYKWIYPKEALNIEEFMASKNIKDIVTKSILLDAFLEDIVIRSNDIFSPFKYVESHRTTNIENQPKEKYVSKKNKDATGTKIKRSKRKIETETSAPETVVTATNETIAGENKIRKIDTDYKNDEDKNADAPQMDVESFIQNEKPISCNDFLNFGIEKVTNKKKIDAELQNPKDDEGKKPSNHSKKPDESELIDSVAQKNDNNVSIKDEPGVTESKDQECAKKEEQNKQNDDKAFELNTETESLDFQSALKDVVDNENKSFGDDSKNTNNESTESISTEFRKAVVDIVNTENKTQAEADSSHNTSALDVSAEKKETTVNKTKNPKDIDSILADMEEKTMKKFKGSVLDSIF